MCSNLKCVHNDTRPRHMVTQHEATAECLTEEHGDISEAYCMSVCRHRNTAEDVIRKDCIVKRIG